MSSIYPVKGLNISAICSATALLTAVLTWVRQSLSMVAFLIRSCNNSLTSLAVIWSDGESSWVSSPSAGTLLSLLWLPCPYPSRETRWCLSFHGNIQGRGSGFRLFCRWLQPTLIIALPWSAVFLSGLPSAPPGVPDSVVASAVWTLDMKSKALSYPRFSRLYK